MIVAEPTPPNVDYALTLMGCWARDEKPGGPGGACQLAEQSILYLRAEIERLTRDRDLWKERHDRERAAHAKNLTEQQKVKAERDRLSEEVAKYKTWAASCDPSPAVQAAISELTSLQTECSTARWVRDHCLGLLRGQLPTDSIGAKHET